MVVDNSDIVADVVVVIQLEHDDIEQVAVYVPVACLPHKLAVLVVVDHWVPAK